MRELVVELVLRLVKPIGAALIGIVVWLVATGPGSVPPSAELAILCWLAGAGMVLLVADGPI